MERGQVMWEEKNLLTRNFWGCKSEQRGVGRSESAGTTQGDKIKIYFYYKGAWRGVGHGLKRVAGQPNLFYFCWAS